jgi:hypothetical protein
MIALRNSRRKVNSMVLFRFLIGVILMACFWISVFQKRWELVFLFGLLGIGFAYLFAMLGVHIPANA